MRQFTVAYDSENAKATVLPVDKDLPDNTTPIGYFDDRDLGQAIDKLQLRTQLQEKNGKEDPVLLHHVETLLIRHGVEDIADVKLTIDKEVKTAQKDAVEAREHDEAQNPNKENTTAVSAQTEPKLK